MAQRDVKFDGLRVIGLLAIILAHVNPPALLFQLRNFDVPLMVLVSGAVYGLSGTKKKYGNYIWGRVIRLLVPTWIFLCIFFLFNTLMGIHFSQETIFSSFALLNGIGYVWIIRVFILVAIIAPFFIYLYRKMQNKIFYLFVILSIFIIYSLLHFWYTTNPLQQNTFVNFTFQNIIFYILPFGCIAGLGLYLLNASKKSLIMLLMIFSGIFGILAFVYSAHEFVPTQAYKYPPEIYYLSYALGASILLYLLSFSTLFQKIFKMPLLQFMSASSLWIYLWQILFLYGWLNVLKGVTVLRSNFLVEYIVIILLSVIITFLQKKLFSKIIEKIHQENIKSFLQTAFLK